MSRWGGHERLSLLEEAWPEIDRIMWRAARRRGGPLDDGGLAAGWSDKNVKQTIKDYGRWLGHCERTNGLDPLASPASRVTEDRLRAYINDLRRTLAPCSVESRVRNLCQMMRVMEPAADRTLLKRAVRRLKRQAKPSRHKASRIVDPQVAFEAGLDEMVRAASTHHEHEALGAVRVRDGLLLAFLAARPLRLANLTALRIGTSLVLRDGRWWVDIDGEETKTGRPQWLPLPHALTMPLEVYLSTYRPRLLRDGDDDRLWLSIDGGPMGEHAIYHAITRVTRRLFGRPVNPHLMRDGALTAMAEQAPKNVRAGDRLLGHASLATGERHYNHADRVSALRLYHEALAEILAVSDDNDDKGDEP